MTLRETTIQIDDLESARDVLLAVKFHLEALDLAEAQRRLTGVQYAPLTHEVTHVYLRLGHILKDYLMAEHDAETGHGDLTATAADDADYEDLGPEDPVPPQDEPLPASPWMTADPGAAFRAARQAREAAEAADEATLTAEVSIKIPEDLGKLPDQLVADDVEATHEDDKLGL